MACIAVKFQKCGKENCRCRTNEPHGPYYWMIVYRRNREKGKGKYIWLYLGRNRALARESLKESGIDTQLSGERWERVNSRLETIEEDLKKRIAEKQGGNSVSVLRLDNGLL